MTLTLAQPIEDPKPNIGSAMTALLAQLPASVAEQIRDAWSDDLTRMFSFGLKTGGNNAFAAVEQHLTSAQTCRPFCTSHITTAADGDLCIGETVRLDFHGPDRPAGYTGSVSLGLGYSADEGDSAFVQFGNDPVYMTAADLRSLCVAGLKMTEESAR